jgi:hypothetical protein
MKDFAMEGDESKMGTAAHLMVQNLAGSLALVTCKEPLRLSMVTHIRNLLLQNGFTDENIPEQAILVLAGENLDLACSVVEKVAMEKAVMEVDDGLSPAYLSRRSHREVRFIYSSTTLFSFSKLTLSICFFVDSALEKHSGIPQLWLLLTTLECSPTLFVSNSAVSRNVNFSFTKISQDFEFSPLRFPPTSMVATEWPTPTPLPPLLPLPLPFSLSRSSSLLLRSWRNSL